MNSNSRKIIFWISTIAIAIAYFVTGMGNVLPFEHIALDMSRLGYPPYFLKILGIWKILAVIAILIPKAPRIKEWVYAGMMIDLTGAALSRFAIGDNVQTIIIPLIIAIAVTIN